MVKVEVFLLSATIYIDSFFGQLTLYNLKSSPPQTKILRSGCREAEFTGHGMSTSLILSKLKYNARY